MLYEVITVGTVRSRLARARSALQKTLWKQAQERGLRDDEPATQAAPTADDRRGQDGKGAK